MKNDIGKFRKQLQADPSDTQARSDLLHELIFSDAASSGEAKQSVIWFINNKPDYEGQWSKWRIYFIDPIEFKIVVDLWKKQVKNYSSSLQTLKNAAQFTAGMDQIFQSKAGRMF